MPQAHRIFSERARAGHTSWRTTASTAKPTRSCKKIAKNRAPAELRVERLVVTRYVQQGVLSGKRVPLFLQIAEAHPEGERRAENRAGSAAPPARCRA